jgi:hypothetical protein
LFNVTSYTLEVKLTVRIKRSLIPFITKAKEQLDEVKSGFLEKIATTLVGFSPVDTGAYVESHSITTSSGSGRARTSHGKPRGVEPSGRKAEALNQLLSDVASVGDSPKVYMNNRSPHNKQVEYGWPTKPGYAVYSRTRTMAPVLLEQAIQEAKR